MMNSKVHNRYIFYDTIPVRAGKNGGGDIMKISRLSDFETKLYSGSPKYDVGMARRLEP
jgi:hypothetical protein